MSVAPSNSPDLRITLLRDGLADARLEGVVAADRYVPTVAWQASAAVAPLRRAPEPDAEQLDQLVFGEAFDGLVERDGLVLGQAARDGYVGWVEAAALSAPLLAPTHRVSALRTYAFSRPDLKSAPACLLGLNALVTVDDREGRFVRAARAGWLVESHLAEVGRGFKADPAAVALRFLHAPYQWGGRESLGLDCSGLVQQALYACGRACPRDSDHQQALGRPLADIAELRRGDLVFWRGHVGIMLDGATLLHANGHHMAVAAEPLAEALGRIEAAGGGAVTALRRLD